MCRRRLPWWSAARRLRHHLTHLEQRAVETTRWSLLAALDAVAGCEPPKGCL